MNHAMLAGFLFYLALAAQLSPQNLFLVKQGMRGRYAVIVVIASILADLILVNVGPVAVNVFLETYPAVIQVAKILGLVFVIWYGAYSARSAFVTQTIDLSDQGEQGLFRSITTSLSHSLFDASTLFDLLVIMGVIAAIYHHADMQSYIKGACLGVVIWIAGIVLVSRVNPSLVSKPGTWRILDGFAAIVMFFLAYRMMIS